MYVPWRVENRESERQIPIVISICYKTYFISVSFPLSTINTLSLDFVQLCIFRIIE